MGERCGSTPLGSTFSQRPVNTGKDAYLLGFAGLF